MKVELTKEEVDEACAEWIERHHGLKVKGEPTARFSYFPGGGGRTIINAATRLYTVEFPDVDRKVTPYRD